MVTTSTATTSIINAIPFSLSEQLGDTTHSHGALFSRDNNGFVYFGPNGNVCSGTTSGMTQCDTLPQTEAEVSNPSSKFGNIFVAVDRKGDVYVQSAPFNRNAWERVQGVNANKPEKTTA